MKRTPFVGIGSLAIKVALFSMTRQNREERGNRCVRQVANKQCIRFRIYADDRWDFVHCITRQSSS